jgi:hypothetical protein
MSRRNAELVARNADACERATWPQCRCACNGALHGVAHSRAWREARQTELDVHDELVADERAAAIARLRTIGLPSIFDDFAYLHVERHHG